MLQSKEINFNGQNVYIGIDVHLKSWDVTIITESGHKKQFTQPSGALALFEQLKKSYPNGNYQAVYESGFTGFSTYHSLQSFGIDCKVIHAADVPTTQYENVMKRDPIDSNKLAKALRSGVLNGIYIPDKDYLDDRSLLRYRKTLQHQLSGYKSRIKHLLYTNGVNYPDCFSTTGYHWSRRFMTWLRDDVVLLSSTRKSLDLLLSQVDLFRNSLLVAMREIRSLSRTPRYYELYNNLISIPGIGMTTAMSLLTEIMDVSRFSNEKRFASWLGLIPLSHSSGDKVNNGKMSFRGNKQVGPLLVESSWIAIRYDRTMAAAYGEYRKRMTSQEAIIRIARKLSNRIFYILKSKQVYEYDKYR